MRKRRAGALLLMLVICCISIAAWAAAARPAGSPSSLQAGDTLQTVARRKKRSTPTATPSPAAGRRNNSGGTPTPVPEGPIIDPQSIADYLFAHGELPDNFITKREAQDMGWGTYWRYVSDVVPGMSLGGDRFGNYEEKLPVVKGRQYYEADCWYTGGKRNASRIIYSNDGHVWLTEDHYQTFTELFPTVPGENATDAPEAVPTDFWEAWFP